MQDLLDRLDRIVVALERQSAAKEYLDTEEAAAFTGISAKQLENWRCERTGGPIYSKFGRAVRYPVSGLRAFMDARIVEPLS